MVLGGLISAGASLAGGLLGRSTANKATSAGLGNAAMNASLQKEFAKHGVRWRVEDAKRAGIHPLYALGGSGATYTPSAISLPSSDPLAGSLGKAGQDIGRAIDATRTKPERHTVRMQALQEERGELENALLRSQIAKANAPQVGPSFPTAFGPPTALSGQGDAIEPVAAQNVGVNATVPESRAGGQPEIQFNRTRRGVTPVPAPEALQDPDITNPSALSWHWRNTIIPNITGIGSRPPKSMLPPGFDDWYWSRGGQEWRPFKRGPSAAERWGPDSRR